MKMMEDLGIKKNGYLESGSPNSNGRDTSSSLDGLRKSFQELVSKAEINFGSKTSSLTEGASIGAVLANTSAAEYRSEPREYARDYDQAPDSMRSEGRNEDPRNNDSHRSDVINPRNDQTDGDHQSRPEKHDTAREPQNDDPSTNARSDTDKAPRDDIENNAGSADNKSTNSNDSADTQNQASENANSNQNTQTSQSGEQNTGDNSNIAIQAMAQAANGTLNITAALSGKNTIAGQAQTGDTAAFKVVENTAGNATTTGQQSSGPSQTASQSHNLGQSTQAAQSSAQMTETGPKGVTPMQQQAAELSKVIGNTTKTQVSVTVTNEAETLTSKPSSSLAAGSALASEATKASSQSKNQSASHQTAQGQNNAQSVAAAQGQASQQQTQAQQAAQQNAQLQAANQGTGAGKGTMSAAQSTQGVSAGAATSGGESTLTQTAATSAANSTQQSSQTQQSQTAQANQNVKTATPGQPIVDQISVKISKALQAGSDRISVQLRPSELGRVDVKMDVGNDGRVLAVVTADNKDTLELLKRDSSDLQRSLEDAGMQLDSGDLSFNLRGEEHDMAENEKSLGNQNSGSSDEDKDDGIPDMAVIADLENDIANGRIDVKA
jgi:flagellar hook-length control protein FliK